MKKQKIKLVVSSSVLFVLLFSTNALAFDDAMMFAQDSKDGLGMRLNKNLGDQTLEGFQAKLEDMVTAGKITQQEMIDKLAKMEQAAKWDTELKDKILAAQAELLDISVVELKDALDNGSKLPDLVKQAGFTAQEFHDKMAERRKAIQTAHLQDLLSSGSITREQYDKISSAPQIGEMKGPRDNFAIDFRSDLQELVDQNVISSDQADRVSELLKSKLADNFANKTHPVFNGTKAFGKIR
ncbi:MAG TPA: hypothetical protein VMX18_01765 [Candidatus Bipolaricaulota bacterium]|nr:hypothetical protein [Candidatus Bipolaricaulota bacterium]